MFVAVPHAESAVVEANVSFSEALRFWFKLGFISFGGPAGQIAIMHRELVERRAWISEERFLHALNFCMLLPGPEAQQLAIYIGWLKHRVLGGVVAGVLFVLPGFLLITGISLLYVLFQSLPIMQGILFGLKAAVLAVVLEAVQRIAKRALRDQFAWLLAAGAFLGIFVFAVPFPIIVFVAAVLGFLQQRWKGAATRAVATPVDDEPAVPKGYALRVLAVCLALWFVPIIAIYALLGGSHVLAQESVFFSKMAVVTFGGAYAVLAYVAQEAVTNYGWLAPDDMIEGLALAETTPGPLILVLTFVGFLGAYHSPLPFDPIWAGILGAIITTWVTFVPCFLWVLIGAPHIERLRSNRAASAALAGVTAAIVGVILNLAVWFALHALFHTVHVYDRFGLHLSIPEFATLDARALLIAIAASIALLRFKAPMMPTLAVAGGIGILLILLGV
jgi:chromate transporter